MVAALVRTVAAHKLNDVGDYTCKSTSVIICQPTGYSLTDRPDELTPFVTWVSVELNVVLTVTSLPLLRPLAQEARHLFAKTREPKEQWDDTISLRSIHTSGVEDEERKTGAGVGVIALGTPSGQEGFVAQQDMSQVVRTVEVQISYEKNETPMIHACLVGLVQGQAMERLAGRWFHGYLWVFLCCLFFNVLWTFYKSARLFYASSELEDCCCPGRPMHVIAFGRTFKQGLLTSVTHRNKASQEKRGLSMILHGHVSFWIDQGSWPFGWWRDDRCKTSSKDKVAWPVQPAARQSGLTRRNWGWRGRKEWS
jgi:hypothetical protein